ncbi:MAG TPA: hypothetical protein VKA15_01315 [Isosphaeraceae bacterium]|nr:hypothetical protein [Isosphaeraceae bacterium]
MNISPVGDPIHDDFYSVAGSGIPDDVVLEFNTSVGVVNVTPDFVRPHLALVGRLPTSIPVGGAMLRLTSPTASVSNLVSVTVSAGPPQPVRLLQAGDEKTRPYTIAFVANPGIEAAVGAIFSTDPVLANRPGYHNVVVHCFRNLFGIAEDILRQNAVDTRIRLVSIFDATRPADPANSLAHEVPQSNVMETRRSVLAPFLASFGVVADIVLVIHGSTTHIRASAWFTSDDPILAGTAYTLDGPRTHGHFPRIPGSAAIYVFLDQSGLTVIHEFGHAASDFNNGKVIDLYNDGGDGTGFLINKRFRATAGSAIPADFAIYNGVTFPADAVRDSLGYPGNWRSYQATAIDGSRPNLMDNYWQNSDPQLCRLDELTYAWLKDRLDAKLSRV